MKNIKLVSSKSTHTGGSPQRKPEPPENRTPPAVKVTPKPQREINYIPEKRRSSSGKAAIIFFIAAIVIIGGLFGYAGYTAQASTVIFPNVTAYGMNVGGLSVERAVVALENSPQYAQYRDAEVVVEFPAGIELRVDSLESGLYGSPQGIAEAMYGVGRSGNFLGNGIKYLQCLLLPDKKELDFTNSRTIDRDAVMEKIENAAKAVDRELMDNTFSIGEKEVTLIKGASGMSVNNEDVYNLVKEAFETNNYTPIDYQPKTDDPKEINLDDIMYLVHKDPVDAKFDEHFNVTEASEGVSFDLAMAQRMFDRADIGDKITIPLVYTAPAVSAEDLQATLYRDILSEHSTKLAYNPVRSKNVELAAATIDETILLPGQVFSYNDVVGERTKDKGYGEAPAYVNGDTQLEIGGGICQVSSTIYYCALLSDLEIVERSAHTFSVPYLPPGMDATVSWGGPNFRFKNNANYPIKIHSWRDGDNLNIQFFGTKENENYVKMTYEITGSLPFDTEYEESSALAPGTTKIKSKGSTGSTVKSYRTVFAADGTEISSKLEANSRYKGHKQIVLIPEGEMAAYNPNFKPDPNATPKPTATPAPDDTGDGFITPPPADIIPPPTDTEETVPSATPEPPDVDILPEPMF